MWNNDGYGSFQFKYWSTLFVVRFWQLALERLIAALLFTFNWQILCIESPCTQHTFIVKVSC